MSGIFRALKAATMASVVFLLSPGIGWSSPVSQVDQISVSGPFYRNDQVTLTITGPIATSLTYTATSDDESGYNAYNVAKHWSEAIAADSLISSFLTITFISPPDSAFPDVPFFTLAGKNPGEGFQASVSVAESCDCDFNETLPIIATISTLSPVSVPEPGSATMLFAGLAGLLWTRQRQARRYRSEKAPIL